MMIAFICKFSKDYFKKPISIFKATAKDIVTKIGFISFEPLLKATLVPILAPRIIAIATWYSHLIIDFTT